MFRYVLCVKIRTFFFVQATFQQFQKRNGGAEMVMNKEQDNNLLLSIFQCCDICKLTVCLKLLQTVVQHLKRDKAGNGKGYLTLERPRGRGGSNGPPIGFSDLKFEALKQSK